MEIHFTPCSVVSCRLRSVSLKFLIIILGIFAPIPFLSGQTLLIPGPEIDDPFKHNPKWREFLLTQSERIERLRVLVNNVWTLIDSIPNPSEKTNLGETFAKFHVPEFIEFFREADERIRDGNPFPVLSTALGFHRHNMHGLLNLSNPDELTQLQLKWSAIEEAAFIIHAVFNQTSNEIRKHENGYHERVLEVSKERFPVWGSRIFRTNEPETGRNLSVEEISAEIDQEIRDSATEGRHLFRGLLQLVVTMRQSYVDVKEPLNYFCYGNNEFGVIPDLTYIIAETGTFLVMSDMKQLLLNVYAYTLKTFFQSLTFNVKESLPARGVMWNEMIDRIDRKINFPFLEGTGWDHPAGPVVFKCDMAPKNILGERGQWGRNISIGIKPNASPTFPYATGMVVFGVTDFPAGPMKENGTVGYVDDRTPEVAAVGFEKTIQGYVESELALDRTSSCRNTCPNFKRITQLCSNNPQHCPLFRHSHCHSGDPRCMSRSHCPSFAMKCQRLGRQVQMCPSVDPSKLYDWISVDGKVIARKASLSADMEERDEKQEPLCRGGNVTTAFERWEMENGVILHTPRYCELCFCTCTTPFNAKDQQYFDLGPLISHVEQGMIVSAIRFVKDGNVISLAIEEGKPLVGGMIDEASTQWVDKRVGKKDDGSSRKLALGPFGFQRINFDLIIGQVGTVVTGIRFKHNDTEKSLNLEIQTTPITWPEDDPTAISLKPSDATWNSAHPNSTPREPLRFNDPGDPMTQKGPSMPDSVLNSYVEMTSSSYETDLGQTVVPLFDTQPVFYYEGRRWLRGVGIMHKGKPDSGGFITPSIVPASPYKSIHYHPIPTNSTVIVV